MAEPPSGTVTLLFSDIEGSTRILQRTGGEAYADLLTEHRRLIGEAFGRHAGFHVGSEGDSVFVVFASADAAAAAAGEAQRALAEHPWPEGTEVRVRMGLHSGEPQVIERGYVGLDVHHAARVMAAAHGGQVLLTESTRMLLERSFELRDLGDHRLKDLSGSQRLYQLLIEGLPADFPPLRTLDNRPTKLPAQPNAFIGRARELGEIGELLARDDVRLLTLTGAGGAGKTRLALQAATSAVESFDHGVFFVSLAPVRDSELVAPTIARTLGLREQPGEPAIEALTEHLRDRRLLLVLDNLEQIIDAAPLLSDLLASSPGLKVVATSRTPLRLSGERTYAVRPLVLEESIRLFVERARAAVPDFEVTEENEATIGAICLRLDGLPLAIELAAPRVRTLTPPALLRRLDQRLALLTGGAQDLDERQRTLRGTIEWSHDLLTPQEKTLFARVGIFVRGCRLEAAEAVCDLDGELGPALLEGLESLVEKSLLRQRADSDSEPRFSMLETIREFALEQLEGAGETDAVGRLHGDWFANLAECLDVESRTGDQPASIARLDDDYANLRAAINRAREASDGELLLRLATALWPFWATRGYVAEGRRALEDAFELAGHRPARALVGLCSLRLFSGSGEGLLDDLNEALQAAEQLGDELTLAQAWNLLGRVEGTLLGAMGRAEEAWTKALEHAERASLRAERAESIGWLMMSANFGPLPVEEGIARCRKFHDEAVDDPVIQANSCIEQAALEAMRGDFRIARELLAEGRQALADLGFTLLVAMSAQEAHYVEVLAGDSVAATRILRQSYAELDEMGERAYLSSAAALLAHTLGAQGELDEAERFSRVSEDTAAREDVFSQVLWRSARGKIRARRGELAEAEALAREAVALAEKTDMLNTQGDTLAHLGEVLALAGRGDEAVSVLEQAASRFE
ncbi:MAG TPA: adenylate/guanylate cyclase domain-containing protein, partial [Gaiellaceae bacterium]|nr:adenylate/guanylate cyclase domain-containing protein [Gaiellaceae bacterium]